MARNLSRFVALFAASVLLFTLGGCRQRNASSAPATDHATSDALELALHADAGAGHLAGLHWPDFSDYQPLVERFYAERGWNPAWVDSRKPTRQALALTRLFAMSAGKGLHPEDYDAGLWPARLNQLSSASDKEIADFDTAMTVSAMRYVSDLHMGRVNPRHFDFGVDVQAKRYDLPHFLVRQVVAAASVDGALGGIEPDTAEYRSTVQALGHYRDLAKEAGAAQPLPSLRKPLAAGARYPDASALAARLVLLGDIDGSAPASHGAYTQAIASGVRNFQTRHDLPNDGKLTPQTIAALKVPLGTRVHQLEDTLERLRWLTPEYADAPIAVNIPEFSLRAFNSSHQEQFEMRVVVGDSLEQDRQTPVLTQMMKYLVFRPFWVVTPTIVKQEIAPRIAADKGYLEAKNLEVVDRRGKPVRDWTADGLAKNLYMVREKPGPKNSLGLVKFMFPNKLNIYLHSTPATELFDRNKRDFSHGCIRVQDPEKLADWVLRDNPDWTPDKIRDAMENGEDNKIVALKEPIPVRIFYATARVAGDGKVHFFNDLYGYDQDMEDVLRKGDPFPVKPEPKQQTGDTA